MFEVWAKASGHRTAMLTDDRRKKISARLREGFVEDDLADACRGWVNDPWPERVQHNDLTVLLRDGHSVEKFRDLWRNGPPVVALVGRPENPIDARIRETMDVARQMREARA